MADYANYPTVAISDLDSTEAVNLSNTIIVDQYDATRKATLSSVLSSLGVMRCIFFSKGGTLGSKKDVAIYEEDGTFYIWNGSYPKTVEAGSTPETSGGVGDGKWIGVGYSVLSSEIGGIAGLSMIGSTNYAGVRSYSGHGERIYVYGKSNIFDNGNGIFELDINDTSTPDDGGTVLVSASGGAVQKTI